MKQISTRIERIVAGLVLCIAFLVMASIIVPHDTQATWTNHETAGPVHHGSSTMPATHTATADDSGSTDPYEGLVELGTIESTCYLVRIYAGGEHPMYTIIDLTDGNELGTLLSAEQVETFFPELPITTTSFDNFDEADHVHVIMSADDTDDYEFN